MSTRQNLLVIMVDQMRYDSLGFTGCPVASTPNIDALAAEGAQFDRAYTSLPSCCPAAMHLPSPVWYPKTPWASISAP